MSATSFKVTFKLDEDDAKYFRGLFREARKAAQEQDPEEIIQAARDLVGEMRGNKKTPGFVIEAVETLEDLVEIIADEEYAAPKKVRDRVVAALAYFAKAEDLIPDDIPVLGFLDDAIMIKFVEEEFKHELWGYRKFRKFRDGAEVRPWTKIAEGRLPARLDAQRAKLRGDIDRKKAADSAKGKPAF
jgi:uncharacterized membrane protein YkvA (DUF1232 family)